MPSLNLDLDFETNPKILRLCSRLKLGDAGFIIPIRLWSYAAKHHPETGTFIGYSVDEMERIVGWHGKPGQCLEALLAVKLLDKTRGGYIPKKSSAPEGAMKSTLTINDLQQSATKVRQKSAESYRIHDWLEHAGHIKYYKRRGRVAALARWAKKSPASTTDATSNATSILQAMPEHIRAEQSISEQNKEKEILKEKEKISFFSSSDKAEHGSPARPFPQRLGDHGEPLSEHEQAEQEKQIRQLMANGIDKMTYKHPVSAARKGTISRDEHTNEREVLDDES